MNPHSALAVLPEDPRYRDVAANEAAAWQRWLAYYPILRMDTYRRIVAGQAKQPISKKSLTVLSNDRDCYITLMHHETDPAMWAVRRWQKILWFKKRISSNWFTGKEQAKTFAEDMKRTHDEKVGNA
jgi:hypothetical protein